MPAKRSSHRHPCTRTASPLRHLMIELAANLAGSDARQTNVCLYAAQVQLSHLGRQSDAVDDQSESDGISAGIGHTNLKRVG